MLFICPVLRHSNLCGFQEQPSLAYVRLSLSGTSFAFVLWEAIVKGEVRPGKERKHNTFRMPIIVNNRLISVPLSHNEYHHVRTCLPHTGSSETHLLSWPPGYIQLFPSSISMWTLNSMYQPQFGRRSSDTSISWFRCPYRGPTYDHHTWIAIANLEV